MTAMDAVRWCVDCDRIEAQVESDVCYRCLRRRQAGEPPLIEQEHVAEQEAKSRYVLLPGYHNAEIS